ncbi:odorant receptor 9a-like [Leptopilina boulardi]|uniref:odorant receptor 9a-like n=1 Tax=Leptopilina boulardi TaxID=63433 RepID=UPI0021F5442E|nr:odorant receptor 9a-like [Leptopilina boulardi]
MTRGLIKAIKLNNFNIVAECLSPFVVTLLTIFLHINFILHNRQLLVLLEKIQKDWEIWSAEPEIEILQQYAIKEKKFQLAYGVSIIGAASGFMAIPIVHNILNLTKSSNITNSFDPIFTTDYGLNDDDNLFFSCLTAIHSFILTYIVMTIILNSDMVFMICNHHASSIYAAIGYKLSNLDYKRSYCQYENNNFQKEMDNVIIFCIKQHKELLRFLRDIHNCFSLVYLIMVMLNIFIISMTGFATVLNLNQPAVAFKFMAANSGQMLHILFITVPCEQMSDHSSMISHSVYKSNWYTFPVSSRRLLLMIMKRSSEPCEFVCGKLYTFSMRNFAMVMKTSISYITVLCSFQS